MMKRLTQAEELLADDIDALAEEEQETEAQFKRLDITSSKFQIEISAEKTKLMTNSANGMQNEIKINGQKLGMVQAADILNLFSQMKTSTGGSLITHTNTALTVKPIRAIKA